MVPGIIHSNVYPTESMFIGNLNSWFHCDLYQNYNVCYFPWQKLVDTNFFLILNKNYVHARLWIPCIDGIAIQSGLVWLQEKSLEMACHTALEYLNIFWMDAVICESSKLFAHWLEKGSLGLEIREQGS